MLLEVFGLVKLVFILFGADEFVEDNKAFFLSIFASVNGFSSFIFNKFFFCSFKISSFTWIKGVFFISFWFVGFKGAFKKGFSFSFLLGCFIYTDFLKSLFWLFEEGLSNLDNKAKKFWRPPPGVVINLVLSSFLGSNILFICNFFGNSFFGSGFLNSSFFVSGFLGNSFFDSILGLVKLLVLFTFWNILLDDFV